MEFFYVVKATQKSGKEDAVIWFTAKSEARANLQLDVELEDAGIETGRGKDYAKPVRTDFPVYNDLPEESTVDYTWCKRYELQDDGRAWLPKAGAESTEAVDNIAAPEPTVSVETTVESVPLENRTPAVRYAIHLTSDKYQTHISKEQQLAASEMSLDEGNTYLQNLLLAKNDIPEIAELSLNAEWKLVQAIKQVFAQDETHEAEVIAAFMADWARADVSDRNQLIEEWRSGKLSLLKSESTSDTDVTAVQVPEPENGIQIDENDDETTRYPVVRMPFRKQLLAQFTADELRHHLTREEYEGICALEMDTDNSYVQNLLLAAENCEVVKGYDTKDLWRYTDAIRKVFSQEKRHELALVLRFTRIWAATDYIDRGILVREWTDGNRISEVGSPAPLKPAKPETTESYKRAVAQNMANLSIEIAIALLYPAYFEPGRYEGLPNDVYHAANGISSTQVKDARVSLMYFNARHVAKTIPRIASKALDMGNLVHALALQPENLEAEFSVEPEIPEDAFTTTATLREFIDGYNASLPALLSADEIKALLEEHNAALTAPVPLGASLEETGQSYMALPVVYQRIEEGQKQTTTAMKACIKEYNATLPVPVKTSGSRDALLEQLAIINPDLVAQEVQKPTPLKVSGTKADMIQAVKSVKPDAVFVDELLDAWRDNPGEKILVTRQQLATARAIQSALLAHPTAGMLLTHPSRAVEVSYFGFDDETGLEVRVRPDLEIELDGVRIGADLKTISMWNVKQESLRARLHREIIDRDYHLSAAMYCETAALDQFFWIFVNKDENYHWIAIIEASTELLELGMLEYRKTMRAIATGFDTGEWPAPIIDDYTDELNDFDMRRLEALRAQA
jgi:exodeoxyribonuclease VIII